MSSHVAKAIELRSCGRPVELVRISTTEPEGADIAIFQVMNGDVPFAVLAVRAMLQRCWARATDPSAAAHHGLIGRNKGPDLLTPVDDHRPDHDRPR